MQRLVNQETKMKISDFNSKFRSDLIELYTVDEVSSLFKIVLEELLSFDIKFLCCFHVWQGFNIAIFKFII